jgi:hypothetical protein
MGKLETHVKFLEGKHHFNWTHIAQRYETEHQSSLAGSHGFRQFSNTDEVWRVRVFLNDRMQLEQTMQIL